MINSDENLRPNKSLSRPGVREATQLCLVLALFLAATAGAGAAERITVFGSKGAAMLLTIWSSTDLEELRPAIEGFRAKNPAVSIIHHELPTKVINERIRATAFAVPDLAISSAADLQIKLVNDGFAQDHVVPRGITLQDWASWRRQAFALSIEPAVIVYHPDFGRLGPIPRSRSELARALTDRAAMLDGRVATYDIDQSGIGYLFASQDSLYGTTYTTFLRSLGLVNARLHCCSSDILDAVETREALVGYNVLGSYALARKKAGAPIEIVLPEDYTLILSRVAIIPRHARQAELSGAFLNFLLSPEVLKLDPAKDGYDLQSLGVSHQIPLNSSLLVDLDPLKRAKFIEAWRAMIGARAPAAEHRGRDPAR